VKYLDVPKYKVRPRPDRFLFDKVLILIGLGILLYLGVFVNYYLLDKTIPTYWNWIIIVGIIIILVLELILNYLKYSNYSYEFKENHLTINKHKVEEIAYRDIKNISYKSNIIDNKFHTGSIILDLNDGKTVKLKYLDNANQAFIWMQKLIRHN
jgi:uncharacterized membrane protein YdbT with pleckstrin-like domain